MTAPDYNRRMATALGYEVEFVQPWNLDTTGKWFMKGNDVVAVPLRDYATDWRELPAILAVFTKNVDLGAVLFAEEVSVGKSTWYAHICEPYAVALREKREQRVWRATGDTLLLAAGALLLRLTEEVT